MKNPLIPRTADMTPCQTKAFDILSRQGNVFLTGAAGTGKSFLLGEYLRGKASADFPVIASTGAAAVLIGGRTFHSFFGLGIMEGGLEATVLRALRSRKLTERLLRAQCVIIDEVSMLSGELLRAAEIITRRVRGTEEPWGGLRVIVVGDFAQLPPIAQNGQGKDWAFLHDIWTSSDFQPALLSTVVRTQDEDFLTVLNFIRKGIVNEQVTTFLNERMQPTPKDFDATHLYAHRARAETHNIERLDGISARLHSFDTIYEGDDRSIDTVKRAVPIPETLHLKEGALIMMRKNDPSDEMRWVNGSLGHITRIDDDELRISLIQGDDIVVEKEKFSYLNGDGEESAAAWNFPISLAWATTIHKAQGASLDRLVVDLSALWEPGQAYVALSRVRSGAGLIVENWNPKSIRVEPLVTQFYDSLTDAMQKYEPRPLFTYRTVSVAQKSTEKKSSKKDKITRIIKLISEQKSIENIARASGATTDSLLKTLEKLLQAGIQCDLNYLADTVDDYDAIRSSFENLGIERLKPVFDDLQENVPYDTLRVVRCIMMAEGN